MKKVKGTFSIDDGDGSENITFSNERAFFLDFVVFLSIFAKKC